MSMRKLNGRVVKVSSAKRPIDAKRLVIATALFLIALLFSVSLIPSREAHSSTPPKYFGVNLASAEFAAEKLPGIPGKDYIYPSRTTGEPFRAMGMNTIRLPVLWERLQPKAFGPLEPAEVARLDTALADLDAFQMVIIDVHNYARYFSVPLDHPSRSGAMLADLWTKLAVRYKDKPAVAFGLMNEPHDIGGAEWRAIADQSIAAIRKTGAKNLILVPGINWTGGHSWFAGGKNSNAVVMAGLVDPIDNTIFEIHQYLDSNSSGTKDDCVSETIGRKRLVEVTQWLRKEGAKGFLGEFGVASNLQCLTALDDMLAFMAQNGDVWVGWTYWAGGDWWGDYHFSIQPDGGRSKPQATVLRKYLPGAKP